MVRHNKQFNYFGFEVLGKIFSHCMGDLCIKAMNTKHLLLQCGIKKGIGHFINAQLKKNADADK